jgi:putative redox protein
MAAIKHVMVDARQIDGFTIECQARNHKVIVDQPLAGGGQDCGPNPLEYLFFSLAGCIITIGHIIAKQRQLPIRNIQVRVEGDLDTAVLMGKSTEVRAGFSAIRVITSIDADMTQAEKEQFLKDVDARCPISDNIHSLTPIELVVEDVVESAIRS